MTGALWSNGGVSVGRGVRTRGGHIDSGSVSACRGVRTRGGHIDSGNVSVGRGVRTRGGHISIGSVSAGRGVRTRGGHNDSGSVSAWGGGRTRGETASAVTRYRTTCGRHVIDRGGHIGSSSRGGYANHETYAGSASRGGDPDAMADTHSLLCDSNHYDEDAEHDDSNNEDDYNEDARHEDVDHPSSPHDSFVGASCDNARMIRRTGDGFENDHGDVHKSITRILSEHLDGPWITYRQVPRDVIARMYDCFKTRWSWNPAHEQAIYEGFIFRLKARYRGIMKQLRKASSAKAIQAGKVIAPNNYNQFNIICDFPPDSVSLNIWRGMCSHWNTTEWQNKSESGKKNRNSLDSSGNSSRHTGGSMGYAEHRARLKRKMNEEPSFKQLFLQTHLTRACKDQLYAGLVDIYNINDLKFIDDRSEEIYADYLAAMRDMYGPDFHEYPDDPEVWSRVQGNRRRLYGIGSADLEYVVTGKPSKSGSGPSLAEYQQSQEEVQVLRTQMVEFEARFEAERKAREELQQQFHEFMDLRRSPSN